MNKFKGHLKNNAYLYFLGFASAFLIFYACYFFVEALHYSLHYYDRLFNFMAQVAILFFTGGIFTAAIKYYQFLNIFQEEFHKVISSSEFDEKLTKQLKQITFSRKFLIGQSNLNVLWEKVTLCMYQREFPEIYNKLKKKIKNKYFEKQSISYYYKNMQLHYQIKLIDKKYVYVDEYTSYTIVRPNTDKFTWDFGYTYKNTTDSRVGIEFEGKVTTCDKKFDNNNVSTDTGEETTTKKVELELEGHQEYHIEYSSKSVENIEVDRIHSFSSDRIIDDLTVTINHDNKLSIIFAPVNNQKFYKNGVFPDLEHAYINRDIFLPGEKFKIFFIRN